MFLLALLGCQAFASTWKGEADLEDNGWWEDFVKATKQGWEKFVASTQRWTVTGSAVKDFDDKAFLDAAEKRLNVTFQHRQVTRSQVAGGTWIRGTADGYVLSAYIHPNKVHYAGVFSGKYGKVLPEKLTPVMPGMWAVAFGNPGSPEGNFPLYRVQ